jgi:hypothetical protein
MDGIKVRVFPEANYRGIYCNGKTLRVPLDARKPITELEYPEFLDVKITSYCTGACPWCAPSGTTISTTEGSVNIESLVMDQPILTKERNGPAGWPIGLLHQQKVDQLHERDYDDELVVISLENGEELRLTPNHRVFTQNRGWVEAGELLEDDELLHLSEA